MKIFGRKIWSTISAFIAFLLPFGSTAGAKESADIKDSSFKIAQTKSEIGTTRMARKTSPEETKLNIESTKTVRKTAPENSEKGVKKTKMACKTAPSDPGITPSSALLLTLPSEIEAKAVKATLSPYGFPTGGSWKYLPGKGFEQINKTTGYRFLLKKGGVAELYDNNNKFILKKQNQIANEIFTALEKSAEMKAKSGN